MERKLATIRKISQILPIEGADSIELAVVDAWKVVVAKNVGHKVGDWVIYCEIDSFLPIREEFEFLRKSSYKKMGDKEGFRLRTVKLRGQISQGLILPLSIFGDFGWTAYEGLDVSSKLGIEKYEPPIPAELSGKVKGLFPSFLRKTDEERAQNLSEKYEEMKTLSYYVTEKLDGSSATYYIKDGNFGVCSRNLELLEPNSNEKQNSFWKVAREMDLEQRMLAQEFNFAIQGELIGEGIQGNPYGIKGQTVRFFNVFNIDSQEHEDPAQFIWTMKSMDLPTVPILETNFSLPRTIEDLLKYAEGKSTLKESAEREGIVIRSLDRRISFKVISNKFLLNDKN